MTCQQILQLILICTVACTTNMHVRQLSANIQEYSMPHDGTVLILLSRITSSSVVLFSIAIKQNPLTYGEKSSPESGPIRTKGVLLNR